MCNKIAGTLEDYHLVNDEPRVSARWCSGRRDVEFVARLLAYKTMDEDAQFLLLQLQRRADHFLPFNIKSNPEAIKRQFGFSKSQFKRALGHLYKARLIEQVDGGIQLIAENDATN